MNIDSLGSPSYQNDDSFDELFSPRIRKLSKVHWTPLSVVKRAASFLAPNPGSKVIDIGSGVGKFCVAAAYYCPDSEFHGIEQRMSLHTAAEYSKEVSGLNNVHFIYGDFTELSLDGYTGIYFYNSFAENLYTFGRIDNTIQHSPSLYNYYANYLYKILEEKPVGTRLTTYHVSENEIPICYNLVETDFDQHLKMWIKR
jgi:SAM-dependent methyltransferase